MHIKTFSATSASALQMQEFWELADGSGPVMGEELLPGEQQRLLVFVDGRLRRPEHLRHGDRRRRRRRDIPTLLWRQDTREVLDALVDAPVDVVRVRPPIAGELLGEQLEERGMVEVAVVTGAARDKRRRDQRRHPGPGG